MRLYAIAYAYPFVPDRILDDPNRFENDTQTMVITSDWFVVEDTDQFHKAIANLLSTSQVLLLLLNEKYNLSDLDGHGVSSVQSISNLFDLDLYNDRVPATCRQMMQTLAVTYNTIMQLQGNVTRKDLDQIYEYFGISMHSKFKGSNKSTVSEMIQKSSTLAFLWLQPYFSTQPGLFWPPLQTECAVGRWHA
jgi:hypothetical protein